MIGAIIDQLREALETWNEKLAEIWVLLTQSPSEFKGGHIWSVIEDVHGALTAIRLSLLVLFFVIGMVQTCLSYQEVKRPEQAVKLFLRFVISRAIVVYGLDIMLKIYEIVQGMLSAVIAKVGLTPANNILLPDEVITAIEDCGFFESIALYALSLIGGLFITVIAFVIILTVYGRFFKLFLYTAVSPVPLSTSASEKTQHIAVSFIKSYTGVCLEGLIVMLSCVIYTAFATSPPGVNTDSSASGMVWVYLGELIFNMLILVGIVKASDHTVKEMMGL